MNNGIQIVKLKFRLFVFLYNKDINYMANFTFQTYIVTMLLNVITSTKVNIYILKLDIDHNDNVLFSNEKDSADYNSFNHIQ